MLGAAAGTEENTKPEPTPCPGARGEAEERSVPVLLVFTWIHLSLGGLSADTAPEGAGTPQWC